jgi:type II secretory ATPase GspE/PulE/Tfp pilus assembly ATPase PilB-like protein
MLRFSTLIMVAGMILSLGEKGVWAQEGWPDYGSSPASRGPGFYFSLMKLALMMIPVWLWVYTADWIGRDSLLHGSKTKLKPEVWNPVFVFTFLGVFLIFGSGLIPLFIVNWLVVLLAYAVPTGIYIAMRNKKMEPEDRVLTANHIKQFFAELGKKNKKVPDVKREPYEYGAPVDFVPQGGNDQANQANLITARQSTAYVPAKELIADAINWRADKILLDYTAEGVAVKYMVDGVLHAVTPKVHEKNPLNRELGDAMLAIYKRISNLKPEERRARQDGKMRTDFNGNKYSTTLMSQGTPTGERVLISFTKVVKTPPTLADLGMREQHVSKLKEHLSVKNNLVVLCSMPGDGLSATWTGMLKSCDRLTRDFVCFEDKNKREWEMENLEVHTFNAAGGETPMTLLYNVSQRQPEVFCIPELTEVDSLDFILDQIVNEERKGIIGFRSKEAVEAILRLLALKPEDPEKFLKCLGLVVNQRLIRKLCEGCKEAYPPPPELLQKLGIPAGRVTALYREKQPPPPNAEPVKRKKGDPPEICPQCRGVGYRGRMAIYEFLVVDDKLREVILKSPKLDVMRQAAKQLGNFNLQDEGILLLAQGVTSLAELQRVMK